MTKPFSSPKWGMFGFLSLLVLANLLAVHDEGLFELGDGLDTTGSADIVGSMAQTGCDWADLFDHDPTAEEIAAAVADCGGVSGAFIADQLSQGPAKDDTTFAKGSSKNDQPLASWAWTTGNSPAKDDLSNVYAYAVLNEQAELIIYAGVERLAPNGDGHIDFEFNQTPVGLDKVPPCGNDRSDGNSDGAPCEFTGEKVLDDILVVMDFENGGSLGIVELRQWDGSNYVLIESFGGEGCNAADTVCAYNNGTTIDGGPWDNYDSNGNVVTSIEANGFTEAGINVTALLGGETPCFATLQTKSRSSSSFNSTLKDFALTDFDICSISITKDGFGPTGEPLSKIGDDFTFEYTIENTGAGELFLDSVVDDFLGDITTEAQSAGCSPLGPRGSCSFAIVESIPDESDDPFVSNVGAVYAGVAGPTVSAVADADDLSVNLFQPSVDIVKTGDTLSTAGNTVNYTITVTNTGSADSPDLTNGMIVDSLLGDLLDPANPYVTSSTCAITLPTGGSCQILAARVVEAGDPDPLFNTVDVSYNPAGGFPNVIADSDDHAVDLVTGGFSVTLTFSPESPVAGDLITYTFVLQNTGDVTLNEISVVDTLLGDLSPLFPDSLAPGETVTITVQRTIQPDDPNPVVNEATATYQIDGLTNLLTGVAGASIDVVIPCALSPGFWKGGSGVTKWDDLGTDYIAEAAGFDTGTLFPYLDGSVAGSGYLDVLNLSADGDVTRQLSFKHIAARLNQAVFQVSATTATLLDDIDVYFAAHPVGSDPRGQAKNEGQALLGALNNYFVAVGEQNCPAPDEF